MKEVCFFFGIVLLLKCSNVFSQVAISDPGCVVAGGTYIYNYQGPNASTTTMNWCVTAGKGTIVQAYGTGVTNNGTCASGTGVGSIYVTWNSAGSVSVSLTTSSGNATPRSFTIAEEMVPGTISNSTQNIAYNSTPAVINCPAATFGYCTAPTYSYQWEQSYDNARWTTIAGATGQNLLFSAPLLQTTYYRRKVTETHRAVTMISTNSAVVNVSEPFSKIAITPAVQLIYVNTVPTVISGPSASGGNCSGSYTYEWEQSTNGGSSFLSLGTATSSALSYAPAPSPTAIAVYYRRKDYCGTEVSYSDPVYIKVSEHLNAGTIANTNLTISYNTSPGQISPSDPTGDFSQSGPPIYNYQWEESLDGAVFSPIAGATSKHYNCPALTTTLFFRRKVTSNETGYTNSAIINVNPELMPGSISPSSLLVQSNTLPGTLFCQGATGGNCEAYSYQWQMSSDGISFSNLVGANTENYSPPALSSDTYYRRKVTCGIGVAYTESAKISVSSNSMKYNFVRTTTVEMAGVTSENGVSALEIPINALQEVNYFDGVGRLKQTVNRKVSPAGFDVIQPHLYDDYGRELVKYLPYASSSTDGKFRLSAHVEQQNFYNSGPANIVKDSSPFAVSVVERSPLQRVLKQGNVGYAWQPDGTNSINSTDHTVKISYETNAANEVLLFTYISANASFPMGTVNLPTGSYYSPGTLIKTRTRDENQNEVIEFKDNDGKIRLRKIQASSSTWAETYYIYDDFGNLVFVLPPEATKAFN